jgi:hypothetical protein
MDLQSIMRKGLISALLFQSIDNNRLSLIQAKIIGTNLKSAALYLSDPLGSLIPFIHLAFCGEKKRIYYLIRHREK